MKQLLEAGVHFGHQKNKWNPKMKEYIFAEKNGIYIIDLQKSVGYLAAACEFIRGMAAQGKNILFVGTKKQAQIIIKEAAEKCGMFYVSNRWLGGCLTNFDTVKKSITHYENIEKMKEDGSIDKLSKKEASQINKEYMKMRKNLEGIRAMKRLPAALFIIDPSKEIIAVKEARKLKIPIVALVDTNCDPDLIDYIIPGNDDALRSIKLMTEIITESVINGKNEFMAGKAAVAKEEEELAAQEAARVGDGDELVESAETLEQRARRGRKEEKIEEDKTIKHKPASKPINKSIKNKE
ncbi:MAG: 30S ribosomal protein S2 [Candidatus Omnitrophica bacterium]|nr:30S ribosomal protein S2 [Candidatus Omnitrophota bacterium]